VNGSAWPENRATGALISETVKWLGQFLTEKQLNFLLFPFSRPLAPQMTSTTQKSKTFPSREKTTI
jgi:hypothetical protein